MRPDCLSHDVFYYPYLEPEPGAGRGLLAKLAQHACVVISDDFPCFFLPRMVESAKRQVPTRFELVDSNGLLPMRAADRTFARAFDFRRFLQRNLRPHLEPDSMPEEDPLRNCRLPALEDLPKDILRRWPAAKPTEIASQAGASGPIPDRSRRCSDGDGGWFGGSRDDPAELSGTTGCRNTAKRGTSPKWKPPAACRPTCTSAIFRSIRYSPRRCNRRAGRRIGSPERSTAVPTAGGASRRIPNRFWTS